MTNTNGITLSCRSKKLCHFFNFQVEHGYVGIKDVRKAPPKHDDTQQSFFLAETLKYLYLMFGNGEEFDLNEWVFNTEAHPLKIMERTPETDVTSTPLHNKAPDILLQGHEPDLQQQKAPDVITDVVDASLVDAVANEDRANLNVLHDTIDRTADEVVALEGESEQQEHAAPNLLKSAADASMIDTATGGIQAVLNVHDTLDRSPVGNVASSTDDRTEY